MEVQNASCYSPYSSAPPTTSPPVVHDKSPYSCVPLPSQLDDCHEPVILHPMLRYSHVDRLEFDLGNPGECTARLTSRGHGLLEPATYPPLPSLSLLIPSFPWPITVHASSAWRGVPVVTVLDILSELDRALRIAAAEDVVRGGLIASGRRQNRQSPRLDARTEPRVLQRLEYLRGRKKFIGLTKSNVGGDVMIVHVE
ncbi:hypothetical protein PC9H_002088 [Pleurotus ostreatus]|uniref:DUF6699 domain-containing protein n=1 Tax=Pleurotus ostreatus TaxID=5322 RepID=A0A8H7DMS4_PLEOS|nr:uncharacterized protein PC9H_002088 [Pleurotus ostreatus]KAF7419497.1 hypothetical protein PC9H_002088 [Pleurotus ostreatus]